MFRCFELAKKGKYSARPNPLVGSVIVYKDKIIGEGYHQLFGEAHAEVNAINAVRNKALLEKSTLYVNLEPCSHTGKTPPCCDLILKYQIPKVVIANTDPYDKVEGVSSLKKQGVEIIQGVLEKEGKKLNKRFFTYHTKKRPYIILKWAQTADGFIDREGSNNWITNNKAKQMSHLWRAEEDAILVGKNTVEKDNPKLDCRLVEGKNPLRIVIDSDLQIESDASIFNNLSKTLVFNRKKEAIEGNIHFYKTKGNYLDYIVKTLYDLNKQSILIEGGTFTLSKFIEQKLWDEARVFTANKVFENGLKAPELNNAYLLCKESIGDNNLSTYIPNND